MIINYKQIKALATYIDDSTPTDIEIEKPRDNIIRVRIEYSDNSATCFVIDKDGNILSDEE